MRRLSGMSQAATLVMMLDGCHMHKDVQGIVLILSASERMYGAMWHCAYGNPAKHDPHPKNRYNDWCDVLYLQLRGYTSP